MSSSVVSTIEDYQYQPLDHATQQIRLVTLLDPLENDDAIRLDIEIFEISEAPPYTALSYVWGPPPSINAIFIAERRLEIRENLFGFLTEFRKCRDKTPSDQHLWIDQLCIDQSDTVERNHQVQMMSDIYSKATSVIAWLGNGSKKADASPEMLARRKCDTFEDMNDAACVWRDAREPAAFAYVLHNEYFKRLWIIQEFILANQIRILVGDVWLVDDTREWGYQSDTLYDYLWRSVSSISFDIFRRSSLIRTGKFTHLDIRIALDEFQFSRCADRRDKIYGLLGLVRLDQHVTVDYEKPIEQLYMDVALIAIQSQCLDGFQGTEATGFKAKFRLMQLAVSIKITEPLQTSHRDTLWNIWCIERLGRFHSHSCPITAMGFERPATAGGEIEQWWFDFQGTRHTIRCLDEKSKSSLQTSKLLMLEDWKKYVPRKPPEETSFFTNLWRQYRERMSKIPLTGADKEESRK